MTSREQPRPADGGEIVDDSSEGLNSNRPRWVNWLFADRRTGRVVIAQFPNLPLWIFLGAVALRLIFNPEGALGLVLNAVADLALLWWAFDEVIRGVNPWRRILGGTVAVFVIYGVAVGLVG